MASNYRKLGGYIREIDRRNVENRQDNLLGLSVAKCFIPSIANTVGTDFRKYKVVEKGQFAYIPDTSRRGDKIAIALLEGWDSGLVSNVYTVFEVVGEGLLPKYLELWFRRPEFDRYARFKSHGSVREIFDWEQLCDVELPIPSIAEQQRIVDSFNAVERRIGSLQQLNDKLAAYVSTLFDESFGAVIRGEERLPDGWLRDEALRFYDISIGKTPPRARVDCFTTSATDVKWVSISDMGSNGLFILDTSEKLTRNAIDEFKVKVVPAGTVLYSFKMTNGRTSITTDECATNEAIAHFKCSDLASSYYAYCYLNAFRFSELGSTSSISEAVNSKIIKSMPFVMPPDRELIDYASKTEPAFDLIKHNLIELRHLDDAKAMMLEALGR